MDFTSLSALLNFALITIIYSTFIAPSLVKLGELKDEIINLRTSTSEKFDYKEMLGLRTLIASYISKYAKLKGTLGYFTGIVVVLLAANIIVTLMTYGFAWNRDTQQASVYLAATLIVLILIAIVISTHLTAPRIIKSLNWLAGHAGYSPVYYNDLFDTRLVLGENMGNAKNDERSFNVILSSSFSYTGYSFIVTIEDNEGNNLYHLSAGRSDGQLSGRTIIDVADGHERRGLKLAKDIALKDGEYKVRLLLFVGPYMGDYCVVEAVKGLSVVEGRPSASIDEEIDLSARSISYASRLTPYTFEVMKNHKIGKLNFKNKNGVSKVVSDVFSLKDLESILNARGAVVAAGDSDGKLDITMLRSRFNKRAIRWAKFKKALRFNQSSYLHLN